MIPSVRTDKDGNEITVYTAAIRPGNLRWFPATPTGRKAAGSYAAKLASDARTQPEPERIAA